MRYLDPQGKIILEKAGYNAEDTETLQYIYNNLKKNYMNTENKLTLNEVKNFILQEVNHHDATPRIKEVALNILTNNISNILKLPKINPPKSTNEPIIKEIVKISNNEEKSKQFTSKAKLALEIPRAEKRLGYKIDINNTYLEALPELALKDLIKISNFESSEIIFNSHLSCLLNEYRDCYNKLEIMDESNKVVAWKKAKDKIITKKVIPVGLI